MVAPPAHGFPEYARKSYRYLRLAIVVAVLALMVAVLIERFRASCWQGSFSAYYYTPVHSMFVGALVLIGICLVAIKAKGEAEDVLLNVAGALAPVVAFVPTKPPRVCSEAPLVLAEPAPFVGNNVLALAIGGVVAVALAAWIERDEVGTIVAKAKSKAHKEAVLGLILAGALIVGGVLWYVVSESTFLAHAHFTAAAFMFVIIGAVVLMNRFTAERRSFRPWYLVIAIAMAVSAAVVLSIRLATDWGYTTLLLETLEVAGFGAFWVLQTFEHWNDGIAGTAPYADPGRVAPVS